MPDMDAPELIEWAKAPGARFVLLSGCAQKGAGTTPLQYRQRMKKAGDKPISPESWEPARENAKNDRRARRRRNGADASLSMQGGALFCVYSGASSARPPRIGKFSGRLRPRRR